MIAEGSQSGPVGVPLHDLLAVACCAGCPHPYNCTEDGCLRERPAQPDSMGRYLVVIIDDTGQPLGCHSHDGPSMTDSALKPDTIRDCEGYQVMVDGRERMIVDLSPDEAMLSLKSLIDIVEDLDTAIETAVGHVNKFRIGR